VITIEMPGKPYPPQLRLSRTTGFMYGATQKPESSAAICSGSYGFQNAGILLTPLSFWVVTQMLVPSKATPWGLLPTE
jgi:hypothetical protein